MKSITIKVPDFNDSFSKITILGKDYLIRFTYLDTFDYWTFGIYTTAREPIIQGMKIVPDHPLNIYNMREDFPKVAFGVDTKLDRIGRYDFRDENAIFFYTFKED